MSTTDRGVGETNTRCLLELDGNLVSLYFLIVRRYVYGWHNPIQRILELWSCELDNLKEVCLLFVMMKFQLEIKTIHKEYAFLTKIPLSLSVTCIFHWKKCLKIPIGYYLEPVILSWCMNSCTHIWMSD
jgi:hypothetical protein